MLIVVANNTFSYDKKYINWNSVEFPSLLLKQTGFTIYDIIANSSEALGILTFDMFFFFCIFLHVWNGYKEDVNLMQNKWDF